jgi:hypothetical protein
MLCLLAKLQFVRYFHVAVIHQRCLCRGYLLWETIITARRHTLPQGCPSISNTLFDQTARRNLAAWASMWVSVVIFRTPAQSRSQQRSGPAVAHQETRTASAAGFCSPCRTRWRASPYSGDSRGNVSAWGRRRADGEYRRTSSRGSYL